MGDIIEFRNALRDKMLEFTREWVGEASGVAHPALTIDDHLYSQDYSLLPFIAVNVRQWTKMRDSEEMGNPVSDLKEWDVQIYYLDVTKDGQTWMDADAVRNELIGILEKNIKQNRYLDNLQTTDADGHREYVFNTEISSASFDSSGQEGEYSFVTVLYLTVYTATD